MFTNILVPLDSSQLAEKAIPTALAIAHHDHACLRLLSVATVAQAIYIDPTEYAAISPGEIATENRQQCTNYLQAKQQHLQTTGVRVTYHVHEGDPAATILDTAVAHNVDLIAMTTHGYTGMTRWLLGSVTEKVLRAATCPVLVLRDDVPINHILITLDGSAMAETVLTPALALAEALGSRVTLLRARAEPPLLDSIEMALMDNLEYGLAQHSSGVESRQAGFYLDALMNRCEKLLDIDVKTAVVEGPPAPAILDYVNNHQVDLVAMATHGRSGIGRWVYGSITEKVLRSSETAMFIVRPPADQFS